jgi:male germ cell-associated kinase
MERFRIIKNIGDGTFGSVSKAIVQDTNELVAIKKMKSEFATWEECLELREIKVLRKLTHPNIIKLKEVVCVHDDLSLIFEFCDKNLFQLLSEGPLPDSQIRDFLKQILQGLSFLHNSGFFHRDIKPENILLSGSTAKIGDFGLAREIRSPGPITEYVSTRWYRAPEVLLHSPRYSWQIDIFAVGCMAAELFLLRPLFPGTSEVDQLNRLCSVPGTPGDWPEGQRLAAAVNYAFPQYIPTPLAEIIPRASPEAVEFVRTLLRWDPSTRPSADMCLNHPYLNTAGRSQGRTTLGEIGRVEKDKSKNRQNTGLKLGAGINKGNQVGMGRHKVGN